MKTFRKIVEVDKYAVVRNEIGIYELLDLFDDLNIFYNENNTGETMRTNFLNGKHMFFEDDHQLKTLSEELKSPFYCVISFYQENGYVGVYTNTTLTKRPNNWVKSGRDGLLYVVYSKDEKRLHDFVEALNAAVNYGVYAVSIVDVENKDFFDQPIIVDMRYSFDEDYYEWENKMKETYDVSFE